MSTPVSLLFFCPWCKTMQPAAHACWVPSTDDDLPTATLMERERLEDLAKLRQQDADEQAR